MLQQGLYFRFYPPPTSGGGEHCNVPASAEQEGKMKKKKNGENIKCNGRILAVYFMAYSRADERGGEG